MTLPSFLLAWSDFNWLGLYAKVRPRSKNERWSFLRTLGFVLFSAALGAVVGLVIALSVFGQPVGWIPWLLGLWFGCISFCWFSVTALCWNQRATRLRLDPAYSAGLKPTRYHFFRWCLGFVYWLLLGLITPLALLVTVENVRGELAWKLERARLVEAGEKLTFPEILGPAVPAAQNAGAAEVFAPYFDYSSSGLVLGPSYVWHSSNALARLENGFKQPKVKSSEPNPALHKSLVDLDRMSAAYRDAIEKPKSDEKDWAASLKLPAPGNPALDVLAATAPSEPLLAEISAAAALPRAQFPLHYDEGFNTVLRHLAGMKSIHLTLRLRCAAYLALNQTDHAFIECTNALNVAELLREEPLLISQLVRYAQGAISVSTVWQGLARHQWTDPQLAAFQSQLSRIDYLPGLRLAFEGERACGLPALDNEIYRSELDVIGPFRPVARAIIRQNQVHLARVLSAKLRFIARVLSQTNQNGLSPLLHTRSQDFMKELKGPYSPYNVIVAMIDPATEKVGDKTAKLQSTVKMAVIACGLERYRIAHGEFPQTLEDLSPQFIADLPMDPVTNQPFKYKRTEDGWFLLYSVGPNERDDGGVLMEAGKKKSEDQDWPWPVPTRIEPRNLF